MRLLFLFLLLIGCLAAAETYPPARRSDTSELLHGVTVQDPYRWMEDVDSPETRAWVKEEVKYTDAWFGRLPSREPLRKRLTALTRFTLAPLPVLERKDRLFYERRAPNQNQPVLYVEQNGAARVLLDPNTMSSNGTAAISFWEPSPDGSKLAYGISKAGSDWIEIHVRTVDDGKDLADHVEWVKFSSAHWQHDNSGFYYSAYPKPEAAKALTSAVRGQRLFFHRLGDAQERDTVIYETPDHPEYLFGGWVSDDGKALVISVAATSNSNGLFYRDLSHPNSPVVPLIDRFDSINFPLGTIDGRILLFTNLDAPRGRVVSLDPAKPEAAAWKVILPEQKDTLESAALAPGKLLTQYLVDVKSTLRVYNLEGKLENELKLPGPGVANWSDQSQTDTNSYYSFESPFSPSAIYRYNSASGKTTVLFQPETTVDAAQFETVQVFYPSKDGVKIPMFLSYKRGLEKTGNNPTLLYGYGGFNISSRPGFSPYAVGWMEMGGVYAVANIRGGGEYGEQWHSAGTKLNKQTVFNDFIAAGEWLIAQKYTSNKKLAILGGSNGGLLVGACVNQRPDLFAAAVAKVGVMDMLRFHKFTIGAAWEGDFGNPDKQEDFAAIRKYSPIHNIKKGTVYPATLITTADHDDRVVPAHSFKYAATMQYSQEGPAPILIRIDTDAGHGGGKPVSKQIDEWADTYAFLRKELGMP